MTCILSFVSEEAYLNANQRDNKCRELGFSKCLDSYIKWNKGTMTHTIFVCNQACVMAMYKGICFSLYTMNIMWRSKWWGEFHLGG